ncbi:uncharacterized protein LOC113173937 [Anabas testudineus]|uniref:uncharacterized protein LOC113173937 n=1 Tax=Anabas testudineus TaxID=64144 RepID=UPI000E4550E2|nr:uncharacterized protein LOC113173937 [Anabas testudineus]
MASLTLLLLNLLLMVSAASAWYYRYYGGSVAFTPKGRQPDGTFEVEFRDRQASPSCYQNSYTCYYGDCGTQTEGTSSIVSTNYYYDYWCQNEMKTVRKVNSNRPFAIRYPTYYDYNYGFGYWMYNVRSYQAPLEMMAHVDMGIRSDTHQPNNPPVTTALPVIRIPRNCPRSINLTVFDPDGDRVRCRVPTDSSTYECGLCGLPPEFSVDENSCSVTYQPDYNYNYYNNYNYYYYYYYYYNYFPIELMVEDFPHRHITVSYTDGSYTTKEPLSPGRHKRSIFDTLTTTTTEEETTTAETPTTTTEGGTTIAEEETTTTTAETPTTTTDGGTAIAEEETTTTTTAPPRTTAFTPVVPITPYQASIPALSKIPLQFSVYVDADVPSCIEGDYIPIFLSPTPYNGANLPAYVNRTLTIKVRTSAQYTTIRDLIVTGPSGILKERLSNEDFLLKWTPTDDDLNLNIPICFFSETSYYYYYYYWWYYNQPVDSELRCVIVNVGHHEAKVTCSETSIKVEVEKDYLIRRNENRLHLFGFTDPSCNLAARSNSTHLVAEISLNSCGTLIEEDESNIIFRNGITSANPHLIVSRSNDVEIAFECAYPKQTNLTLGFTHKNPYAFTDKGFGTFTFQFEFFESQRFLRQINDSRYPVEVDLKQMMFMQIEAATSIPNVELFVESCRATPYDNPNSPISYTIIDHGCVKDKTVRVYPGSNLQYRFAMEAFEFIGAQPEVYITCSVLLCESGVPGTRCSQGCIPSHHRGRREVAAESSRHSISQGPLHLVKPSDSRASGLSINLGMNVVFIVGCLLVCGVVIYRVKRSKAKYQPLPMSDSD